MIDVVAVSNARCPACDGLGCRDRNQWRQCCVQLLGKGCGEIQRQSWLNFEEYVVGAARLSIRFPAPAHKLARELHIGRSQLTPYLESCCIRNIFSSRLHSGAAALVRTVIGAKRIARKLPRNKRASIPANLRNASTILNWQPLMAG